MTGATIRLPDVAGLDSSQGAGRANDVGYGTSQAESSSWVNPTGRIQGLTARRPPTSIGSGPASRSRRSGLCHLGHLERCRASRLVRVNHIFHAVDVREPIPTGSTSGQCPDVTISVAHAGHRQALRVDVPERVTGRLQSSGSAIAPVHTAASVTPRRRQVAFAWGSLPASDLGAHSSGEWPVLPPPGTTSRSARGYSSPSAHRPSRPAAVTWQGGPGRPATTTGVAASFARLPTALVSTPRSRAAAQCLLGL